MTASPQPGLVGRVAERKALAGLLDALGAGQGALVAIEGEPGIGKSRLLAHLADAATEQACVVLRARASEFEADLPFALWTEALDDHLADLGERRRSRLGVTDSAALSAAFPALGGLGDAPAPADRHRTHRALRDLLGRLADTRPLVLCLDDVHWGDRASVDALAALVRRPADGPVLLAVAAREGQLAPSLAAALADALRQARATRLALAPLSGAEAAELVGDAAAAIYPETGGNPFYLEQLARVRGRARATAGISADAFVPPAVAAAMATELAAVAPPARRLLDAAAVAGDPFEPGLAAEVAELSEPEALEALDELLACALVRQADVPRRFAFRHPVVRHAVYEATPPGWRLGAHARAAHALERQGAGPVERAYHVEHAARPGDEHAIGLLAAAAGELQSPAPAAAARFHAAALRLLPDRPEAPERRREMQRLLADAQAASGDPVAARETLLEALRTAGARGVGGDAGRAGPAGRRRKRRGGRCGAGSAVRQPSHAALGPQRPGLGAARGRGCRCCAAARRRCRRDRDPGRLSRRRPARVVSGRGADGGRQPRARGRGDAAGVRQRFAARGAGGRAPPRGRRPGRGAARLRAARSGRGSARAGRSGGGPLRHRAGLPP